jgi:hypothetical protein
MADTPAPDCLTSLIGLSRGEGSCVALPDGDTAFITDSATGLFLDSVEGLSLKAAPAATPAGDVWQRLKQARELAAFQVRAALEAKRAGSYGIPLYSQRGVLGGQGNGQLMPVGTKAVMGFYTNARREGAWRITRLQVYLSAGVIDAPLLLDNEQVALLTADGGGATTGLPAGGLLIPLDGNYHTLEVLLPDGVRVKANNFFAGCFSCQAGSPWSLAVKNNLQNVTATTPGNGFALSIVEECTADPDFLCFATGKDAGATTFRYPEIARYIGIALLYKAAELFTIGLLAGKDSNRYTMLEPKSLDQLGSHYNAQAAQYIGWLNSVEGLGTVQHPCFLGPPSRGVGSEWTL